MVIPAGRENVESSSGFPGTRGEKGSRVQKLKG
jgi:hypothetical protein